MTAPAVCSAARHGDALAYQVDRCRCPHAREDYRIYRKRLREGRWAPVNIDATGTSRRLRALGAIGWPAEALGDHLGASKEAVQRWRAARTPRVHRDTAAAVAALYDRLSATPGPSAYTRQRAASFGWAPPLLWDDLDIDDPTAHPAPDRDLRRGVVDLDDVDHLLAFGVTLAAVADRLAVEPESIAQARRRAARRTQAQHAAARPDPGGGRLAS